MSEYEDECLYVLPPDFSFTAILAHMNRIHGLTSVHFCLECGVPLVEYNWEGEKFYCDKCGDKI